MEVNHGRKKYKVQRFPTLPPINNVPTTYNQQETPRDHPSNGPSNGYPPLSSRSYAEATTIDLGGIEDVDMEIVCHDHTAVNLFSSRNGYKYAAHPPVTSVRVPDIKEFMLKIRQKDGTVVNVLTTPK